MRNKNTSLKDDPAFVKRLIDANQSSASQRHWRRRIAGLKLDRRILRRLCKQLDQRIELYSLILK